MAGFCIPANQQLAKAVNSPILNDIRIYPNPASDYLTIHSQGAHKISNINIFTMEAKRVFHKEFSTFPEDKLYLNISTVPIGTYLVSIGTNEGKRITKRLTIIR